MNIKVESSCLIIFKSKKNRRLRMRTIVKNQITNIKNSDKQNITAF